MSAEPLHPAGHRDRPPTSLPLLCDGCGSPLVQPLHWTRAGTAAWEILLRCPECESVGSRVLDDEVAAAYGDAFDRATDHLAADIVKLAHAVFESEIEEFAVRLHAGHVVADDFA